MKNASPVKIISGLFLVTALLFMGCSNVFSPSVAQTGESGRGNVTVSFTDKPAGRTLLPSLLDFDLYEFTFIKGSYSKVFEAVKSPGGSFTFSLPQGDGYSLDVNAYRVIEGQRILAATGGSAAAFEVSSSVSVTIILTGNLSGNPGGTFSYNISYPGNAEILRMVLTKGSVEINLLEGAVGTGSGVAHSVEIPAGWYGLEVDLLSGDRAAFDEDIVSIFSDTVTFYGTDSAPVIFGPESFREPRVNFGIPVTEWHGFRVITEADREVIIDPSGNLNRYDQYHSGARATKYFRLKLAGNTYQDVLRLEPPLSGKYPHGSMALVYDLPEDGNYTVAMKVWMESDRASEIVWHYLGDDRNILRSPIREAGQWVSVAQRITHVKGAAGAFYPDADIEWLYLDGAYNDSGLQQATIYIRDVQIILDGDTVDESFLNEPVADPDTGGGGDPGYGGGPLWLSHTGTITLAQGSMRRITANQGVTWSSSNPSVATANQEPNYGADIGLVVGMNPGTATVTVTGGSDSITLTVIVEGAPPAGKKYIALTFDDGPGGYTGEILDAFRDMNARASFFIIGGNVSPGSYNLLRRMRDEGHDIANHTYSHSMNLYTWNYSSIKSDLDLCMTNIAAATSDSPVTPAYIRAPALYHSQAFSQAAGELGLSFMGGELTYDSGGRDPNANGHNHDSSGGFSVENLVFETLAHARPWGIIINHDNGESAHNLAAAMRQVIPQLRAEGYEVVSLSEMVAARKALGLVPGAVYDDFGAVPEDPKYDELAEKVASVSVSPKSLFLLPGQKGQLVASVLPVRVPDRTVTWSSSNPAAAAVDSFGNVTAAGIGTAIITATTNGVSINGSKLSDSATVSVVNDLPDVWHGFSIPGLGLSASGATGIKHETLSLNGSYNDVLQIVPPTGGYSMNGSFASMPLFYVLPEAGTYRISMKVLVTASDRPAEVMVYGYNRDSLADFVAYDSRSTGTIERGSWLSVSGTTTIGAGNTAIGLIGLGHGGDVGLRNATVYVRDLKLDKVGGGILAESASNEDIPGPSVNQGVSVTAWNGFALITDADKNIILESPLLETKSRYDRYYSGAIATRYENFEDPDGNTYNDVLEVKPPNGGFSSGMALIYDLPGEGTYSFTMKVWLESGKTGNVFWQYLGNDTEVFQTVNGDSSGKWVTLTHTLAHQTSNNTYFPDYSWIYLNGNNGSSGLRNAAVYIRDVVVKKNGTIVNQSTPNGIVDPGESADYWHGFSIPGLGDTASGASWVKHETLSLDGTYNDVLEIIPPSGGYVMNGTWSALPLQISLDEPGTYQLSMKLYVEQGGAPADVIMYGYSRTNSDEGFFFDSRTFPGGTAEMGCWLDLGGTLVFNSGGNVAGLIGIGFKGSVGLRDATVYIRDLKLVRNGVTLVASTPND